MANIINKLKQLIWALADIFLCCHEQLGLKIVPQNLNLFFIQYLSYQHPDIIYPFEVEGNDTISFLHIEITHENKF